MAGAILKIHQSSVWYFVLSKLFGAGDAVDEAENLGMGGVAAKWLNKACTTRPVARRSAIVFGEFGEWLGTKVQMLSGPYFISRLRQDPRCGYYPVEVRPRQT